MKTTALCLVAFLVAATSSDAQTNRSSTRTLRPPTTSETMAPVRMKIPKNAMVFQRTIGTNIISATTDQHGMAVLPSSNTWAIVRLERPKPIKLSTNLAAASDRGLSHDSSKQAKLVARLDNDPMTWDKHRGEYWTTMRVGYTNGSKSDVARVAIYFQTHNVDVSTNVIYADHEGVLLPIEVFSPHFNTNASIQAYGDIADQPFEITMAQAQLADMSLIDVLKDMFPGSVLFLVVLGSGMGGALKVFRSNKSRHPWYWFVGQGFIAGPLIVALVVGLRLALPTGLVQDALSSGWTLFAVAAIGGFGGAALFAKMSKQD